MNLVPAGKEEEQDANYDLRLVRWTRAARGMRRAREVKRRFAGKAHERGRFAPVIVMVVGAVEGEAGAKFAADEISRQVSQVGGENVEIAQLLQRVLAGERDPDALCHGLSQSAPLVETVLQTLADLSTLNSLLSDPETAE